MKINIDPRQYSAVKVEINDYDYRAVTYMDERIAKLIAPLKYKEINDKLYELVIGIPQVKKYYDHIGEISITALLEILDNNGFVLELETKEGHIYEQKYTYKLYLFNKLIARFDMCIDMLIYFIEISDIKFID